MIPPNKAVAGIRGRSLVFVCAIALLAATGAAAATSVLNLTLSGSAKGSR
jgi:hypothetical protein